MPHTAVAAVSADARLFDRLSEPATLRVHSRHERTVNLLQGDFLFCISTDELDDAPRTVRVGAAHWPQVAASADEAQIIGSAIWLDSSSGAASCTILLDDARRWAPSHAPVDASRIPALVEAIEASIRPAAARAGFERAVAAELTARTRRLEQAVAAADGPAVVDAARRLLGLGVGLTPSGDDVLCGLALVANLPGAATAAAMPALRTLADDLPAATTPVSAATLAEALDGRGRDRLHRLLSAATTADRATDLAAATASVRAIGHTSGADLLAGIRCGLRAEQSLRSTASRSTTPRPTASRRKAA